MRISRSKWSQALGLAGLYGLAMVSACSGGGSGMDGEESAGNGADPHASGAGGSTSKGASDTAKGGDARGVAGARASGGGGASTTVSGGNATAGANPGGPTGSGGREKGLGAGAGLDDDGEGGSSLGVGGRRGDGGPGLGKDGAIGPGTGASGGAMGSGGRATGGATFSDAGKAGTGGAPIDGGLSECPYSGHVSYTLSRASNPNSEEQAAYGLITTAMDKAIEYYNCYTNIVKNLNVQYVPSVSTADANINGSLRFGQDKTYMDYRTAMHEIAHSAGIGTASNWSSLVSSDKLFKGASALAELQAINATLAKPEYTEVHADSQHFWPYGINYQSEVKSEADLLFHCRMVMAIRKDLGNP